MKTYTNTPDEISEDKVLRRVFTDTVVKSIDSEKRQIKFIISTASVDRYRDIVDVNGWDLKNYKKNPVVLFGHHSSIPPIGKAVKTWKEDDSLMSLAEFMPPDISQFAYSIFRMYEEKYLRAVSVGFKPKDWEWIKDEEGKETGGIHFKKHELLEFSAVPIPANPEALVAARSCGIDTMPFKSWADEMLDNWNKNGGNLTSLYGVKKEDVEMIRRRAAGLGASIQVPPDVQDDLMRKNLEAIRAAKAAKAKAQTSTITVAGEEIELPIVSAKEVEKAGTFVMSQEEINGVNVLTIDKADDTIMIDPVMLGPDTGASAEKYFEAEVRENDDEVESVIRMKASNLHVEYELVGVSEEGSLMGMKVLQEEVIDNNLDSESEAEASADEGYPHEPEIVDDEKGKKPKPNKPKTEDEDEDEEGKAEDEDEDEDESEKNLETFADVLAYVEQVLCAFEESVELSSEKMSKHESRKAKFLAGFMRELADRLDGGTSSSKSVSVEQARNLVTEKEEQEDGLSAEEANDYMKSLVTQLQPMLTELVKAKVNKLRGRLD